MPSLEAQTAATRIMLALTGRRWTWPRRHVIEQYLVPETVNSVNLSGRPVSGINSVVDQEGNSYTYVLSNKFHLYFPALANNNWIVPWPTYDSQGGYYPWAQRWRGTLLTIDYVYGNPPPQDVQKAIDEFATQLDLIGSDECQLPSRITTVAREGLTWTVLDPQQFLTGGKTGLYYPDLVISTYGNMVKQRARVFSPEHAPPRRIFTEILDPNSNQPTNPVILAQLEQELTSQVNPNVYTSALPASPYLLNQYDTFVGGSLTPAVPLAASVAPGSTVGFKKADSGTTSNTLTPTFQGSDRLNSVSGATSFEMDTLNEVVWLTSNGTTVWTRVDGDLDVHDGGSF